MKMPLTAPTAALQFETQLRHYTGLHDFAPASSLTLQPDSTIVQANYVAAQMLGVTRAKLVNQRFVTLVATADRPAFTSLLARTFASNALETGEVRAPFRGGPRHVRAKATKRREILDFTLGDRAMLMTVDPLLDTRLQCSGAVQVVADITERKWMEARLRHAQKTEAISELAGGMAHEFNNLLASLMMHLELVKTMPLPPEAHSPLEEMGKLSRSAADLLGQLLTFGRQSPIRLRPLDWAAVITEQVRLLARVLGENIKVEFARAEIPAWVNADPGAMEQVLLTLCLNARDAMKNGSLLRIQLTGAEIKTKTAAAHPDVQPSKFVCWAVSDTGCGMTPEIKRRLVEIQSVGRDITERKQATNALLRLNRELKATHTCHQALLRATDEPSLLPDLCQIVCREAGYRLAWVGYAETDPAKTVRPVAWARVGSRGHRVSSQTLRAGNDDAGHSSVSAPGVRIPRSEHRALNP